MRQFDHSVNWINAYLFETSIHYKYYNGVEAIKILSTQLI